MAGGDLSGAPRDGPVELTVVDAFTSEAFSGNPAAVCVLDGAAGDRWMQQMAAELNLSETAFLHPEGDGWALRWFTPTTEVDLCGHATLASAHVLLAQDGVGEPLRFRTRSGRLTARRSPEGLIELDFPATPAEPAATPAGLTEALGLDASAVSAAGRSRFDVLVEVGSERAVRDLAPDFRSIAGLEARGVIVTAAADPGGTADVVSRFFAPGAGIDEDPVTGSAHCVVGPWWLGRLGPVLRCRQASPRGGEMTVTVRGDRVLLAGAAVSVLRSTLLV